MRLTIATITFRILLGFIFAAIIGLERQKKGSSAGFRTHILVCVGSTLIMLVSLHIFELFRNTTSADPGRIAAGVITGIGFLGAGAIIRSAEQIKGLTTAASIWVSAAIGLAVGCGFIFGAALVTFIAFTTLFFLKRIEKYLEKRG